MNICNVYVLNSSNRLKQNGTRVSDNVQKVSSGKRINKGADDASGVGIAESFKSKVRGLAQAQRNCQDGVSMLQTADGTLDDMTKSLHRMKEISVEAANDTLTDDDRAAIDKEFQSLKKGIDEMADKTDFNGIKLLKYDKSYSMQVKENPYTTYTFDLKQTDTTSLGIDNISIGKQSDAVQCIGKIDEAVKIISARRTQIGSDTNNLQHFAIEGSNAEVNSASALSRIEDIDTAKSMAPMTKDNIISDYNRFVVAGANQDAKTVVDILNRP